MGSDPFTHPDNASLVDPLFAARKEGELQFLFFNRKNGQCGLVRCLSFIRERRRIASTGEEGQLQFIHNPIRLILQPDIKIQSIGKA